MKDHHHFVLTEGVWLGEGKLSFTSSPESLKFYTRWTVDKEQGNIIRCIQGVEVDGMGNKVQNQFTFLEFYSNIFALELISETLGKVEGKGVIDEKTIAWEFRDQPGIEGYEIYERQEQDKYNFHAEYLSTEQNRSVVNGKIWKT